ncbi:MAG: glycosyltransferase family 61 protein [Chromatiales bacterium]|nr:glycosyltransferase family 61 protein [Chromatiales bacterium]
MTDKQIPILVSEGLHANLYALLDRVRAPDRPVMKLNRSCQHSVLRLIYPSDLARIFDTYDRAPSADTVYLPVALLREMAAKIKNVSGVTTSSCGRRLYIRRNSSYRRLLNQPEIESLLIEKNFEVVDPGNLTLEEQIDLFSQASITSWSIGCGHGEHAVVQSRNPHRHSSFGSPIQEIPLLGCFGARFRHSGLLSCRTEGSQCHRHVRSARRLQNCS